MKFSHTPAPWELRQSANGYWFIDHEQGDEGYTLTKLECGERDARLIAAAPELLAALQNVAACFDANDPDSMANAMADARAAIAKATGGAA
jgi:type VI protein secretion system component VasF